ncbi:MAG: transposase [Deferribacteres bacterium]|nr:transposase [candidate division KSB1 bacterium]MCB9503446.1 transposase [Deferribacteres bacterium]
MKRKVQFVQGNYYHVFNRGANRENIFREDENYLFLLKRLGKLSCEFNISIIAYCLMPNHCHFLLRQNSEKSIIDFMQRTFNSYTKAFNRKYRRSGTLFEGPFKAIHVDEESYLVYLCR